MLEKRVGGLTTIPFVVILLLTACGGLSGKQRAAANDAMKTLRKIQAATQVGVNFQQYGLLVIEAKAQVNEALLVLPDGELKDAITGAMKAYVDANVYFQPKITDYGRKYGGAAAYGEAAEAYLKKSSIDLLWRTADLRLDHASSLIK